MRRCVNYAVILMTLMGLFSGVVQGENTDRIQPYAENPYYWQYNGEPVMLLGGSKDDNLFQIPDLEKHLDLMQSVGGNYIRNTMSSRDDGNVQPFHQLENGKYDLDQWNPEYWRRFKQMLELTGQRKIFVQIEFWDQWDYNRGHWDDNPWNPDQNVNYSTVNTQLRGDAHYAEVDAILGQPRKPDKPVEKIIGAGTMDFFLTVPTLQNDTRVLAYQQKFIEKVLSYSLRYDHILYTVTNELFMQHSPEWSRYWASYVKAKAAESGIKVEITEMLHNHDIRHEQHRVVFDHPELFDFIDISQNSLQETQQHWQNLRWVREYIVEKPRPINHTKTYGAPGHSIPRFWRNIIGGAASCRFHRPPSGIGLNERAQNQIRSARMLLDEINIFASQPDAEHTLLSERKEDEAYLTYIAGEEYALYFPEGGSVQLDLTDASGTFAIRWLNIEKSEWAGTEKRAGGKIVTLEVPAQGKNWAVVVYLT